MLLAFFCQHVLEAPLRAIRIVVCCRLGTLGSADSLLVGERKFALLGCQPGEKTIINRFSLAFRFEPGDRGFADLCLIA